MSHRSVLRITTRSDPLVVRDLVPVALRVFHIAMSGSFVPIEANANITGRIERANFTRNHHLLHVFHNLDSRVSSLLVAISYAAVADFQLWLAATKVPWSSVVLLCREDSDRIDKFVPSWRRRCF